MAAVVVGALTLVGGAAILAASGVGFVPGHLGSLGKRTDDEDGSENDLSEHRFRICLNKIITYY